MLTNIIFCQTETSSYIYGPFSLATAQIRKTEGNYGSWIFNYGYLIDISGATILYLHNPDNQKAIFVGSKYEYLILHEPRTRQTWGDGS